MNQELINYSKDSFWDSLNQGIKERMSSAIFFNYVWYWIIFNWEFVYFTIFGDQFNVITNKVFLAQINGLIYFEWVWPIVLAAATSIILPFLNMLIKQIRFFAYVLNQRFKPKIAGLVMLPADEHERLYRELLNKEKEYQNAIAEYKLKNDLVPDLIEMRKKYEPFYELKIEKLDLKGKLINGSIDNFNKLFQSGDAEIESYLDKNSEPISGFLITNSEVKIPNYDSLKIVSWTRKNEYSTFILTSGSQTNPNRMNSFELRFNSKKFYFIILECSLYHDPREPERMTYFVGYNINNSST